MRIVLAAELFDPLGVIELDADPTSVSNEHKRRVNRIATLDGGAVFNDFGYTAADRTFTIRWAPTGLDQVLAVAALIEYHPLLRLCMPDGVFLVAPESFLPAASEARIVLLASAKLSA